MRSTSRFLNIPQLLVISNFNTNTQAFYVFFNSDESWKMKSCLNFSDQVMPLFRDVVQEFLMKLGREIVSLQMFQGDNWPNPTFDLLKTYYANRGIEFQWRELFNDYGVGAKGRNPNQFTVYCSVSVRLNDVSYHLTINSGNFMNENIIKQVDNIVTRNDLKDILTYVSCNAQCLTWVIALVMCQVVFSLLGYLSKKRFYKKSNLKTLYSEG